MKFFAVFDPATGEIMRAGTCPDRDFDLQGGAVETETPVSRATHYFDGKGIAEYTKQQAAEKAAMPMLRWRWSNESLSAVDLRTLDDVKGTAKAMVAADVTQAEAGQMRAMREMLLAQATGDPLPEGAKSVLAAVESTAVDVRHTMQAIDAATTKEEVEAILAGR